MFKRNAMRSFETAPSGERLFYRDGSGDALFGFQSVPYIIPDAETEQRLFTKQLWRERLQFAVIYGGAIFVGTQFFENSLWNSLWFLVYLVASVVVVKVAGWLIFRSDLGGLARAPAHAPGRFSLTAFCRNAANRHGRIGLLLRFLGSLAFAAGGVWILASGYNVAMGLFVVAFFGFWAIVWVCSLYLKLAYHRHQPTPTHGAGSD